MFNILNKKSCFWGHKWGKWIHYTQDIIDRRTGIKGVELRQKRYCLRCNKMQDEFIS